MYNLKACYIISIVVLISTSLVSPLSFAFENEPDNFRGIKWGTNISELHDMILIRTDGNNEFYKRTNDKLKIGDGNLISITYSFYEGRFYCVYFEFKDMTNFSQIKATLEHLYGDSFKSHKYKDGYWWNSNTLVIMLAYNEISNMGDAVYYFMPIKKEMEADEKDNANKDK
jgi:hypothetical protein